MNILINKIKLFFLTFSYKNKNKDKPIIKVFNNDINNLFNAYQNGSIGPIKKLLKRGYYNINRAVYGAHDGENIYLINENFINYDGIKDIIKDFNLDLCLYSACRVGNNSLINDVIHAGSTNTNYGFQGACEGSDLEIAQLMIYLGAEYTNHSNLFCACKSGNRSIIDLLINNGANDWTEALKGACAGGHLELVHEFIERGASVNIALFQAAYFGDKNILNLLLSVGANNWKLGFMGSLLGNHKNLVEFFINKAYNDNILLNINDPLYYLLNGTIKTVPYIIDLGHLNYSLLNDETYIPSIRQIENKIFNQESYSYLRFLVKKHIIRIDLLSKKSFLIILNSTTINRQIFPVNDNIEYLIGRSPF